MSFDKLKKNSTSAIEKLVAEAEKLNAPKGNYGNDDYWTPTVDKAGNGYAIIRFLPACEGEDLPWVQYWDHGFKGATTGRWYIENSLTTLGQPDPVSEANSILWNSGREEDKQIARDRKRRLHYVSRIEVISDPANPDNDGKVFKFKYGKKIFDKITEAMTPQFEDEAAINPFDFWAGANFKLKIRNVEGYRNYDKSEFDKASPHRGGDDKQLKEIYESLPTLADIVDPKNFKSYNELKAKFHAVIGVADAAATFTAAERISLDETKSAPSVPVADEDDIPMTHATDSKESGEAEVGTLAYFAQLAKGK